jgi:hypothetical protein
MPIDQLFKIVVKESGEEERLLLPYPTFAPRLFSARIFSSLTFGMENVIR